MADANSTPLSEPHAPKPASIEAFKTAFHDIKNGFHKARMHWDEHEPEMFSRVKGFTDHELLEGVDLEKDLVQVRIGETSYGLHLFGKIKLQKVEDAYIHVRLFVTEEEVKFHCLHKEDHERGKFNAILHGNDQLVWFNE